MLLLSLLPHGELNITLRLHCELLLLAQLFLNLPLLLLLLFGHKPLLLEELCRNTSLSLHCRREQSPQLSAEYSCLLCTEERCELQLDVSRVTFVAHVEYVDHCVGDYLVLKSVHQLHETLMDPVVDHRQLHLCEINLFRKDLWEVHLLLELLVLVGPAYILVDRCASECF